MFGAIEFTTGDIISPRGRKYLRLGLRRYYISKTANLSLKPQIQFGIYRPGHS